MHVPGHKNMTVGDLEKIEMKFDMTEIPELDNLHAPLDVLFELNEQLSRKYAGYHAQAMVNGTTTGVLASVYAAKEKVETFIIAGDAHKSIFHALELANVHYTTADPEEIIHLEGDAGVIITHPTYHGASFPYLKETISRLKVKGCTVIVDEAHGAHGDITPEFLPSSMNYGADYVIQSYHKMLPALTGASVIFVRDETDYVNVQKYIDCFETSSPSYLILLSIELSQNFYEHYDASSFFESRAVIIEILSDKGIIITACADPAKLVLTHPALPHGDLERLFREAGIYSEMVSDQGVLWCLPLFDKDDRYPLDELKNRIEGLSFEERKWRGINFEHIDKLLNKKCIRTIVPYPPGVPLVMEGEEITAEHIKSIKHIMYNRVKMEGIIDNTDYYAKEDK